MTTDTTIVAFHHPDEIDDPLTSVLRDGARRLLAEAIEAEAENILEAACCSVYVRALLVRLRPQTSSSRTRLDSGLDILSNGATGENFNEVERRSRSHSQENC